MCLFIPSKVKIDENNMATVGNIRVNRYIIDILEISIKYEKSIQSFILWVEFKRNMRV